VIFRLPFVLYALLWFTAFYYSFGIFKLFPRKHVKFSVHENKQSFIIKNWAIILCKDCGSVILPYKLILESHVILYVFWLIKKLRLFVNVLNLTINVTLKESHAVVTRWFSLSDATLGLFKFISDYLSYFEKNKYIFQYQNKKSFNYFVRIDRNAGYTVCTIWLRIFLHEPNKNCDQPLIK